MLNSAQRMMMGAAGTKDLLAGTWVNQNIGYINYTGTMTGLVWTGSTYIANYGVAYSVTSTDLVTWSGLNSMGSIPAGGAAGSMVYGAGLAVVVGASGIIRTSPDGVTWTTRTSGTTNTFYKIIWTGSLFVAVGGSGTIRTSTDGITWTTRTSGTTSGLTGITWSGSLFVAVGDGMTVLTSSDAITWTVRSAAAGGAAENLYDVAWSPTLSLFVAVGNGAAIRTSPDGVTWTIRTAAISQAHYYVGWIVDKFVASVGTDSLVTSSDGINWVERTKIAVNAQFIGRVNSLNVITGDGNTLLLSNNNGINWSVKTTYTTFYSNPGAYRSTNNRLIMPGIPFSIYTDDGTSFGLYRLDAGIYSIIWTGSRYMASYRGPTGIYNSTDGVTWTTASVPSSFAIDLVPLIFTGTTYITAFRPGSTDYPIFTSTDTVNWTKRNGTGNDMRAGAWNGTIAVLVGSGGVINTSDASGVTWTSRTSGTSSTLNGVVWSSFLNLFVAVGDSGVIITSSDGITWTTRTSGTTNSLNDVCAAPNGVIAVGDTGTILTSYNGTTWTTRTSGTTKNLSAANYVPTPSPYILVVGAEATVLKSS